MLTIVDEYTRECLAMEVERYMKSNRLAWPSIRTPPDPLSSLRVRGSQQ